MMTPQSTTRDHHQKHHGLSCRDRGITNISSIMTSSQHRCHLAVRHRCFAPASHHSPKSVRTRLSFVAVLKLRPPDRPLLTMGHDLLRCPEIVSIREIPVSMKTAQRICDPTTLRYPRPHPCVVCRLLRKNATVVDIQQNSFGDAMNGCRLCMAIYQPRP